MTHMQTHSPSRRDSLCTNPHIATSAPAAVSVCVLVPFHQHLGSKTKQPGTEPAINVLSTVAAPCVREADSCMHQCVRDFTQAAPVCISIRSSSVLLHAYFMSTGSMHVTLVLKLYVQCKHWLLHRWQMGGWEGRLKG